MPSARWRDSSSSLVDQAIGAADWRLTGVLRQPGGRHGWQGHARLAMRLAMTVILSTATSTGASMAMFHDAIKTQLEADVRGKNREIEEQYAERIREHRTLRFGSLEADVQRLTASVADASRVLDAARALRATASQRAEAYQIEADRELKGAPGYKAGAGSKYREAQARKLAADSDLAKAASDIEIYEPRLAQAQAKLDAATAALRSAENAFAGEAAEIDAERKSKLVPDRNDALMSYLALQEVYEDPRFGEAAQHFSMAHDGGVDDVRIELCRRPRLVLPCVGVHGAADCGHEEAGRRCRCGLRTSRPGAAQHARPARSRKGAFALPSATGRIKITQQRRTSVRRCFSICVKRSACGPA
ncbi:MAG: DUF4407 domain-containing protein [Pseudorhodoplanes sp.]|nr:DUF4407 domain-containing protein [Pseudorhodoplanes sp.]